MKDGKTVFFQQKYPEYPDLVEKTLATELGKW